MADLREKDYRVSVDFNMADLRLKDYGNHSGPTINVNDSDNHSQLSDDMGSEAALNKVRTAGGLSISPELFEKIYLSAQDKIQGNFRKTFGNPTPICLIGNLLSLTPLTCDLLGWGGAGGSAANIGAYFGFGAILMILGGVLEFVLGNTFSCVVYTSFGAFWFTFGATFVPSFNAYGAYSSDPSQPVLGLESPTFAASFGFFFLWMGVMCFIYLIAALRTNVASIVIFATLTTAFGLLAAEHWLLAQGNASLASNFQTAAGSFLFVTCAAGWYLFVVQVLASVDFPLNLPVGDLSTMIKGRSERTKVKEQYSA